MPVSAKGAKKGWTHDPSRKDSVLLSETSIQPTVDLSSFDHDPTVWKTKADC